MVLCITRKESKDQYNVTLVGYYYYIFMSVQLDVVVLTASKDLNLLLSLAI